MLALKTRMELMKTTQATEKTIHISTWNVQGIRDKLEEVHTRNKYF